MDRINLHISRNYKLFKHESNQFNINHLHISRNYKLFKPYD